MKRLTDKRVHYTNLENVMDSNVIANFDDGHNYELNNCAVAAMLNKLKDIEDILENYHIESVEELDETLEDNTHANGAFAKLLNQAQDLERDRETWKRACELVCMRDVNRFRGHFNSYEFTPSYFYAQAQKEMKK